MNEVQICNLALQKIGTRSTIAALTEDSNEARNCNLLYAPTRDEVLGMAFWNFARSTRTLALLKSAPGTPTNTDSPTSNVWVSDWPAPPWLFEYAYPDDCIQLRYITPQPDVGFAGAIPIFGNTVTSFPIYDGTPVRFVIASDQIDEVDTNVILTNQYQAIGTVTKRVTNTNLFSAQFVNAFSSALAGKLAISLTGDKGLANMKLAEANDAILQARVTDGNEGLTIQEATPDWLSIRNSATYLGYNWAGFITPYAPLFAIS